MPVSPAEGKILYEGHATELRCCRSTNGPTTDENRHWLPSFVLPRDPVIRRLLSSGQRYLMCLSDDSSAGYDGYQQGESGGPSTGRSSRCGPRCSTTIHWPTWNPPPVVRMDVPAVADAVASGLAEGRRNVHRPGPAAGPPVASTSTSTPCCSLPKDTLYPGYWRSEEGYADFLSVSRARGGATPSYAISPSFRTADKTPPGSPTLPRTRELLNPRGCRQSGTESKTTMIAGRTSFATAVEEGAKNLQQKADFNSMIDIRLARDLRRHPRCPWETSHESAGEFAQPGISPGAAAGPPPRPR